MIYNALDILTISSHFVVCGSGGVRPPDNRGCEFDLLSLVSPLYQSMRLFCVKLLACVAAVGSASDSVAKGVIKRIFSFLQLFFSADGVCYWT